jgi:hypothetical protein
METVEKKTAFSHRSHSHYCHHRGKLSPDHLHKIFDTIDSRHVPSMKDDAQSIKGPALRFEIDALSMTAQVQSMERHVQASTLSCSEDGP